MRNSRGGYCSKRLTLPRGRSGRRSRSSGATLGIDLLTPRVNGPSGLFPSRGQHLAPSPKRWGLTCSPRALMVQADFFRAGDSILRRRRRIFLDFVQSWACGWPTTENSISHCCGAPGAKDRPCVASRIRCMGIGPRSPRPNGSSPVAMAEI